MLDASDWPDVAQQFHLMFNLDKPCKVSLSAAPDRGRGLLQDEVAQYIWQEATRAGSRCYALTSSAGIQLPGTLALSVRHPDRDGAWIGLLLIARPHRRQGYGSEAVNAIHQHLATTGYRTVGCAVELAALSSQGFWKTLGYAESHRASDDAGRES